MTWVVQWSTPKQHIKSTSLNTYVRTLRTDTITRNYEPLLKACALVCAWTWINKTWVVQWSMPKQQPSLNTYGRTDGRMDGHHLQKLLITFQSCALLCAWGGSILAISCQQVCLISDIQNVLFAGIFCPEIIFQIFFHSFLTTSTCDS